MQYKKGKLFQNILICGRLKLSLKWLLLILWNKPYNRTTILLRTAEQKFLTRSSYCNLLHIHLCCVFHLISEVLACFPSIHSPNQTICILWKSAMENHDRYFIFWLLKTMSGTDLQRWGQKAQPSWIFWHAKLKEGG